MKTVNVPAIADYIAVQLDRLMTMPTSQWPDDIKIDTSSMGPRVTDDQPICLRLSYGIACSRRQWYCHNEPEKESNPSSATVQFQKFSVGDMWEIWTHALLPHCMPEEWTYRDCGDIEVDYNGIKGHLDGVMVRDDGAAILMDSKHTSEFRVKKYENGLPDELWGQRHQAQNYTWAVQARLERGEQFFDVKKLHGFIWPTQVGKSFGLWGVACGYAEADNRDLISAGKEAMRAFRDCQVLTTPPRRWTHTKICTYCNFKDTCGGDPR